MLRSYPHVLRYVLETPWAILPSKLQEIAAIISDHMSGDPERVLARLERFRADQEKREEAAAGRGSDPGAGVTVGDIGIVPIQGTMVRRAGAFEEMSGAMSTARLAQQLDAFAADPKIKGIFLDIDSPGGSVDGTPELGAAVARAAGVKPVFASANGLAASAAYWVGSQATEFAVAPSGIVGSIGVLSMHTDFSKQLEQMGRKVTIVRAGKFKAEGNPYEPLGEEARVERQRIADAYHAQFIKAVSEGRSTSQANVRENYGQGRVVMAQEAVARGMVDRVETAGETLSRLVRRVARAEGRTERAKMETVRDFEAFLRDAGGFSREEAKQVASSGFKAGLDGAAGIEEEPREAASGSEENDAELSELLRRYSESVGN